MPWSVLRRNPGRGAHVRQCPALDGVRSKHTAPSGRMPGWARWRMPRRPSTASSPIGRGSRPIISGSAIAESPLAALFFFRRFSSHPRANFLLRRRLALREPEFPSKRPRAGRASENPDDGIRRFPSLDTIIATPAEPDDRTHETGHDVPHAATRRYRILSDNDLRRPQARQAPRPIPLRLSDGSRTGPAPRIHFKIA